MGEALCIGIDLGTTNSCVSYYKNGKAIILENREGGRTTPSYIFFPDTNDVIVGEHAKKMADLKPDNGVYEVKRLMGKLFNDPNIQKSMNYFDFQIISAGDKPVVVVKNKTETVKKTPEELSAYILKKIKADVEDKLGQPIVGAVITVPAYFNVSQREATLRAATKAGFTVLKLLNEPTAAALSYFHGNDYNDENYFMVYDLGGGTFDVAILKKTKNKIEIVCVDGDSNLGGHDFDNLIMDYIRGQLIDHRKLRQNRRRKFRILKNRCEDAKKYLSTTKTTEIALGAEFHDDNEILQISLSREKFEQMADGLFRRTIAIVDDCLKNSKLSKSDIKEVILAGGLTRIPKIQKMISDYFGGKILNKLNNLDECVAKGAAIQAALLLTHPHQKLSQIKIVDVTALSLGVDESCDIMSVVIKKNSLIPTSQSISFSNVTHNQSEMLFKVYEGERMDVRKNYCLGELIIDHLTPAPPGEREIIITMTIDLNGILTVSAKEKMSNNTKDLKIAYSRGEVKSAIADSRKNEEEDREFLKFAKKKMYLIQYCYIAFSNFTNKDLMKSYKEVYDRCLEVMNLVTGFDIEDKERVDVLKEEIINKCAPLVEKYKFEYMPNP